MRNYILLFVTTFFLLACSDNQVKKNVAFNQNSQTGIVVLGVTLNTPFPNPTLLFRKYDPITGIGSEETFSAEPEGSNLRAAMAYTPTVGEHSYFVLKMPAGHWFLDYVFAGRTDSTSSYSLSACLSTGTNAFVVGAGKVSYIGEYSVDSGLTGGLGIGKLKDNIESAKTKLLEFENIKIPLTTQESWWVSYECIKNFFGNCDTSKIIIKNISLRNI